MTYLTEEEAAREECPFKPKQCDTCNIAWHWVGWRRDDGTVSNNGVFGPRVGYCGACRDPGGDITMALSTEEKARRQAPARFPDMVGDARRRIAVWAKTPYAKTLLEDE